MVFFFYENHLILSWNYSKILEWKYFITPWLFTRFWPKPILLSQCLPASNTENRCLWQEIHRKFKCTWSKMVFCKRFFNYMHFWRCSHDNFKVGTSTDYEFSVKPAASLSPFTKSINLRCLHGGKTGFICCTTKDSEQNW